MEYTQRTGSRDTRKRLLAAAEQLFIDYGFDGMSLRLITSRAGANLAAVNYHYGTKEALLHEVLSQRMDRLNRDRLSLLETCERAWDGAPDCATLLGVLFIPALRLNRDPAGGPAFMRLLGRVYSDASPFVRDYLHDHYQLTFERFFEAFARALPGLSRNELGLRLHFALKGLAGVMASEPLENLVAAIGLGEPVGETEALSRLISLVAATVAAPFAGPAQAETLERLFRLAGARLQALPA